MRIVVALLAALLSVAAHAERILLIPLDSRPATGQFAQMIAKITDVDVRMPPYEYLGRFTVPGKPDAILDWLAKQKLSDVGTVIASADMVSYGGLIASRVGDTPEKKAIDRLRRLADIVRRSPGTKLYVLSSTMRLAPTATRRTAGWRLALGRYAELREMVQREGSALAKQEMARVLPRIPKGEVEKYYAIRQRNENVRAFLIRLAGQGRLDYLTVGQDDARPYGPHITETVRMKRLVRQLGISGRVYFCEGIDQLANVLLSRALLREAGISPRVKVVYAEESAREMIADYESKPIHESLEDQLYASGARPVEDFDPPDYTLYVNTPSPQPEAFESWSRQVINDLEQGNPTAVADIDLGEDGTVRKSHFEALWNSGSFMRLLSFAGWNTAGNTIGTTIPAANVAILARRGKMDPLVREVAQREFLLHRVVDDYAYHRFVRPQAYSMIDERAQRGQASREETYGEPMDQVNDLVRQELRVRLDRFFGESLSSLRFEAGGREYRVTGLTDVKIWLPWPRAYEVRLEFRFKARATDVLTGP